MTTQEKFLEIISEITDYSDDKTEHIFSLSHLIKRDGFLTKEIGMKILH